MLMLFLPLTLGSLGRLPCRLLLLLTLLLCQQLGSSRTRWSS